MGSHARVFCCDESVVRRYRHAMRHATDRHGFTLLEVLVAAILLTAGIGALLRTASLTTRMTVQARQATRAMQAATTQMELLRGLAALPPAHCGGLADGTDSMPDGTVWRWRLAATGSLREASVAVSVPVPGGRLEDTVTTTIWCP